MIFAQLLKISVLVVLPIFGFSSSILHGAPKAAHSSRPIGDMKGLALVNNHIKSKILDPAHHATHGFIIEAIVGEDIYDLRTVLGSYNEELPHHLFSGGEPNPYNIMLWHLLIERLAIAFSESCSAETHARRNINLQNAEGQPTTFLLSPNFSEALQGVCNLPDDDKPRRTALGKLWRATMGYGYDEEMSHWIQFFMVQKTADQRPDFVKKRFFSFDGGCTARRLQ